MSPEEEKLGDRVAAVRALLEAFRLERVVYLIVTVLSLVMLFTCAVLILLRKEGNAPGEVIGLFGSGGTIAISAGRVLKMWGDALRIIGALPEGEPK